jgi:Asp/Glu/hydantoin racemase
MVDVVDAVAQALKDAGLPAPVIDPSYAAITLLQSLIRCGLSQSRLSYYASTAKLVTDPKVCLK